MLDVRERRRRKRGRVAGFRKAAPAARAGPARLARSSSGDYHLLRANSRGNFSVFPQILARKRVRANSQGQIGGVTPAMTGNSESVRFPPVDAADDDGLLMVGGQLTPSWTLSAYRQGVFPWPMVDGPLEVLAWFAPDPRAILPLDRFRVPRRVQRRIRRGEFEVTANCDFGAVVRHCAAPRRYDRETWITRSMSELYHRLFKMGHAHSIEVWKEGELVGGVLGISLGGLFSAESMFHRATDAGKVGLHYLVQHLRLRGFQLIDIQQWSPHMARLGALEIPRRHYMQLLPAAIALGVQFGSHLETAG